MQGNSDKKSKKRAVHPKYESQNQLTIPGFENPFDIEIDMDNRWVRLANVIPWDEIVSKYYKILNYQTGRPPINGRVIIGAVMIKHMQKLTDRETISQIQENMYYQYFLGYKGFQKEEPFDPSLFVEIRERLGLEFMSDVNELIYAKYQELEKKKANSKEEDDTVEPPTHKGKLLIDATVCPQNITFPTDIKLINAARRKAEQIIDKLHNHEVHGVKVRTYREMANKDYLNYVKKKKPSKKTIQKAIGKQLRYLRRNILHINRLLDTYGAIPLKFKHLRYFYIIQHVYEQQNGMYKEKIHHVADRIVNIHQPHVRPIVRGKERAYTEFGSKVNVSLVDGYNFIDQLSWDAYNEGKYLEDSVEKYKERHEYYPEEVLADQIYCSRENRNKMKEKGIKLIAKPLGRPKKEAVEDYVRPGERNPIEGKFGQGKIRYGLNCIQAKLKSTSESWIASIFMVLNLAKLAGSIPLLFSMKVEANIYRIYMNLKWRVKYFIAYSHFRPIFVVA